MNIRKAPTLPEIVLMCQTLAFGQSFQGTVIYSQDIILSKAFSDMGITKEQILTKMRADGSWGDTVKISYDNKGNYFSAMNNKKGQFAIYKAATNKIYTFAEGKESESCAVQTAIDLDLEGAPDKPEVKKLDTAVTVNGSKCTGIRVQWKLSRIDYYFNANELRIDPELFSNHTSDGWVVFLRASKALPLKIVKDAKVMTLIQTAVSSKPGPISSDLFIVPTLVADESLNIIKLPNLEIMRVK